MDASALTALIKQLNEANAGAKTNVCLPFRLCYALVKPAGRQPVEEQES